MHKFSFKLTTLLVIVGFPFFFSCHKTTITSTKYLTEKVIIIVMDGARFSETWGDSTRTYTPNLSNTITSNGCVFDDFYNNGDTYTSPGHLAILSGQYYNLNNSGSELPPFPTIFQYFNETFPNKTSWLIASKDKLEVLTNTSDTNYNNLYLANSDCGINGLGTGYREDSVTLYNALNILSAQAPDLTLINFREPEFTAHMSDSFGYLNQIKKVDSLIYEIFKFTETNSAYKGKTTIFITNDHGRHDNLNGGYSGHGDNCLGCRQIMLYATGPDFKTNAVINSTHELIDIAPTVAELMCFDLPNSQGKIMTELFK